jgi:phage baseplate assembly protein W
VPPFRQSEVENPHLQLPFKLGGKNGGAFVNEQDSYEDIYDCVKAICAYPVGSNVAIPGFGIPDIVFRQITVAGIATALQASLRQWEPRSDTLVVEDPTRYDELVRKISINVRGDN